MKNTLFLITCFCFTAAFGQQSVKFSADSIVIDKIHCFIYERIVNDLTIKSLDNEVLITGSINTISPGKFSTKYTFLTVNKEFYNEKINGRNDLIFSLIDNDVISSCALNEKKLLKFIKKYNQLP